MSATAVALIAASVALHVTWNAISRSVRPSPSFFLLASLVSSAALTPVLLWYGAVSFAALVLVLPALVPTGAFACLYNVALSRAYLSGDLSLVYPLARSLGPVGIALVSVALGRGAAISLACAVGIATVAVGSVVLPLPRLGALRLARYRTPAFLWSLATAVGTVGYTLLDDQALRWIRADAAMPRGTAAQSVLYAAMQAWATTIAVALFVALSPREHHDLPATLRRSGAQALAVGIFGYASYILVLAAMAYVDDVTYVAAFRQLGVPLALVIGVAVLREPPSTPRIVGGALCTAGLLLVALG